MIFLTGLLMASSLVKLAAPHVRSLVAARELSKPGMAYREVAQKTVPVDGVWSDAELPLVLAALQGGDQEILTIGQERVTALISAGCPHCPHCRKMFPGGAPGTCDRCGHSL